MIRESEVFKIGVITKTHGVNGEVAFLFTDDVFDRVDCDYLICKLDGILVPFFFEEYRFKNDNTALFKFQRLDSAESVQPPLSRGRKARESDEAGLCLITLPCIWQPAAQ